MQRACFIFLEQTVYDLGAHVVLVVAEQRAVKQFLAAHGDIVIEVQAPVSKADGDGEPGPQGIVDGLVRAALGRNSVS